MSARSPPPWREAPAQHLVAPFAQCSAVRGEADLVWYRELIGREKGHLGGVVVRLERTADRHRSIQNDNAVLSRIIEVAVNAKQRSELDDQARFLSNLTPCRLLDVFAVLDETTRDVPVIFPRLEFAARQQHCAIVLDNAAARGRRVPVKNLAAASADAAQMTIKLAFDGRSAAS